MKIKIFKGSSNSLENQVNDFLLTLKKEQIFQIKYSTHPFGTGTAHSCMIVYSN